MELWTLLARIPGCNEKPVETRSLRTFADRIVKRRTGVDRAGRSRKDQEYREAKPAHEAENFEIAVEWPVSGWRQSNGSIVPMQGFAGRVCPISPGPLAPRAPRS